MLIYTIWLSKLFMEAQAIKLFDYKIVGCNYTGVHVTLCDYCMFFAAYWGDVQYKIQKLQKLDTALYNSCIHTYCTNKIGQGRYKSIIFFILLLP